MDNKIKYVDLNGLKTFAEALKQDLKNHVIELGLYQELLHRIENLELYKIVDSLPEIGDENTIYLLKNPSGSGDKNIFIEYLYNNEHGWEEIGNFTPSFDLEDYVRVEDAPFNKGGAENSAVLKEGNNRVISEGGVALGKDNCVGLKGWYINNFNYVGTKGTIHISNQNTELGEYIEDDNFNNPYEVGDIISIQIGSIFTNIGCIDYIKGNHITFDYFKYFSIPQSDPEKRYYCWVFSKPNAGVVDLGQNAMSCGLNNQSLSECAYTEGKNNKSFGKYAHVEGKENEAHYCSHVEGSNNIASGNTSHAEGEKTKSRGVASHSEGMITEAIGKAAHSEGRQTKTTNDYTHAEGYLSEAGGIGSHAEGVGTQTKNNGEHAEGRFNKSNSAAPNEGSNPGNTAHSVGIGTSSADRKNAHEIMQDGKHYILGIGGYNGTNPDKATDVASELTELSAEVSGLSEKIENLPSAESSVFEAVYGVTTYEELKAAYDSGKVVHCDYQNVCYVMSSIANSHIFFSIINANNSNRIYVRANSTWGQESIVLENTTNKVTSLSASSTDTQYPSAKAVYAAIQQSGGSGSSATPDWNAREGENGYIKNKPFYNNVDYVINKGGEYKNVHNESNVTFNNKILFNLGDIAYGAAITINSGPPVTLEKRYESDGTTTLIIEDVSNYLSTYPIIIGDLVTIPEIFIPDTIARKSDIVVDPIVWKYLCNPCVIKNGEQVPEDLLGSQDTFKYTDRGMYIVYDEGSGSSYTIEEVTSTEINLCMGGYVEIVNGCWETNF